MRDVEKRGERGSEQEGERHRAGERASDIDTEKAREISMHTVLQRVTEQNNIYNC